MTKSAADTDPILAKSLINAADPDEVEEIEELEEEL
jgi:hypothetical protein